MKKVLYTATVVRTHINVFHIPYLKMLKEAGFEVHVAAKDDYNGEQCIIPYCDRFVDISFTRNPFSRHNFHVYKALKRLIETEKYDLVHCHTPVAAVLTRLAAAKARKKLGTKVIYTAHGFHFYKGAPLKHWLIFYPVEWLCSWLTDCIITINNEDYECVFRNFIFPRTIIRKIDGIGVDLEKFSVPSAEEKAALRKAHGYEDKFVLLYTAEFIPGKNHVFLIKSMKKLSELCPNVKLLFAGSGEFFEDMKQLAETEGVSDFIDFLGFCRNMPDILKMCDVVVSASVREGFGMGLVEGMATGLPPIASVVRGHKEMVVSGVNGFLYDVTSTDDFCSAVLRFSNDTETYKQFSERAAKDAEKFSLNNSLHQMAEIYGLYFEEFCQNG